MKKFLTIVLSALILTTLCGLFTACTEAVELESFAIIAPASTQVNAGEQFTLEYTTVPAEAAERIKVNWEISDSKKLSYKNGEFTALTCGSVTVTAHVKGSDVTDTITLSVEPPAGYTYYTQGDYALVYPSNWQYEMMGAIPTWTDLISGNSINATSEDLNKSYFSAPAGSFQAAIETTYSLMGITVNFIEPVTLKRSTYLGVQRVQVNYHYSMSASGVTVTCYQKQLIFNDAEANLSCILTFTVMEEDYSESASLIWETVSNQFMPA